MKLILSEEQQFLKDTAKSFARDKTPTTHFRKLRDDENTKCWDDSIWQEMVQLGWSGILVPEEFGGSDPYCKLQLPNQKYLKTRICDNT